MQQKTEQFLPAWGNPGALGFIALAVSLFPIAPVICGWVDPRSMVFTVPWGIAALIALIIVTVIFFRNREMMLGTAFGVLGILLSGGLAFQALQGLMLVTQGVQVPASMAAGSMVTDAMVWVIIGSVLIPIGYLAGHMSKPFAILVWLADVGVWMVAAVGFGVASRTVGIVGGYFIFILAVWFLYMGIAQLVNGTLSRQVVCIGKPLFKGPSPPPEA